MIKSYILQLLHEFVEIQHNQRFYIHGLKYLTLFYDNCNLTLNFIFIIFNKALFISLSESYKKAFGFPLINLT